MSTQTLQSESIATAHKLRPVHDTAIHLPAILGAMISTVASSAELKATAAAVLQESRKSSSSSTSSEHRPASATRSDSVQEGFPLFESEKAAKLQAEARAGNDRPATILGGPLSQSPMLSKPSLSHEEYASNRLPAVSPPSVHQRASPPQLQQLPSIRHLTHQLSELAEIAMREDTRNAPQTSPIHHHHRHSLSSVSSSSHMPYYSSTYSSTHNSASGYALVRSPSSTIGDLPSQFPHASYHSDRRSSTATDSGRGYPLHPMRSASSSGDSGLGISSVDGYSTAHTTPVDLQGPIEHSRHLPPPLGMMSFKCDFEGCVASFQTQYLLSSHKNVHSSVRTHFCPVKDCPRGEGGKGFKRKNEMIRHGLVHKSPGYVCPFCPDVERKYPRPDNLQRHVRVHHGERDRDDPALREVLAQRTEGAVRANRRRRTIGTVSVQS